MYFHIFQLVPNVLNVSFFHLMWAVKKAKNNIILNHSHFGYYCQSFIVLNILMIMGKKGFKSSGFLTSLRTSTHAKFHLKYPTYKNSLPIDLSVLFSHTYVYI